MDVKLMDWQPNALDLLIYTKNTRLKGEWDLDEISRLPMAVKLDHLDYMTKTIQSSFEFVSYTFDITGVTRNFTHQLVRTRNACYAQESQRTVDIRDTSFSDHDNNCIRGSIEQSLTDYANIVDNGTPVQDARDVLPASIHTGIIARINLRELMHMGEVRLCKRTQGEYQTVFKLMVQRIREVHPYFADLIRVYCAKHGICCFPNYEQCPVQPYTKKITQVEKNAIQLIWEDIDHVANPIAKNGKTM